MADDKDKKKKKKDETQEIPQDVMDELPDSVKAELGMDTGPKKEEEIFSSEQAKSMTEAMNKMSDGFAKIGLTLIGRMGEFATTLERIMMIVARIEKVENLVAEMKYFMKGLQKTLNNLENSVNNISNLDFTSELAQMKNLLANVPVGNLPAPTSAPAPAPAPAPQKTTSAPKPTSPTDTSVVKTADVKTSNTALDDFMANPVGEGIELAKKSLDTMVKSIKAGDKSELVAELLEKCKEFISQKYKWSPALYEIGKVAREFKNKKDVAITAGDISNIQSNIEKWKSKL